MGNTNASQAFACSGAFLNCSNYAANTELIRQETEEEEEGNERAAPALHDVATPPTLTMIAAPTTITQKVNTATTERSFGKKAGLWVDTSSNDKPQRPPVTKKAGLWVDEDRSQSEPLPPESEYDNRAATRDLIQQHRKNVDLLKRSLSKHALYNAIKHDDLWLLRYLLSHKTVANALPAAENFLVYRHKMRLDEKDIRHEPPSAACAVSAAYFNCISDHSMVFCQPDPNRGIVLYMKLTGVDQTKLAAISDQEWPFWYILEWMFQSLDCVTRRTGRLTKGIRFIDLDNFSLSQNNRETMNRNAQNARDCQDHYPQMLASVFMLNVPSFFQMCFRMMKPLLPKRFVEKFDILPKLHTKRLLPHMRLEDIPKKYGGSNETWPPTSNSNRNKEGKDNDRWQATIALVKDSSHLVEV